MFHASSRTFDRRAARAGGERRPIPASRVAWRPDATIGVDIVALETTADPREPSGFSIGLPESFFHTANGETVRFFEPPAEKWAVSDGRLEGGPEASAALAPSLAASGTWRTRFALFASVAIHLFAAASLLTWVDHGAQIAGGTPNEIAGIGNAAADQIASGHAVSVTIMTIPVVKAHPVKTEIPSETAQPEPPSASKTVAAEPVRETPLEAVPVAEAKHAEPEEQPVAAVKGSQASEAAEAAQTRANADPVEAGPAASVSGAPEILAAPVISDSANAAPVAQALVEAAPDATSITAARPAEATRAEDALPAEILPAEDQPKIVEHAPLPTPRPKKVEKPAEKAEKRIAETPRKKPVRSTAQASAPGSRGRDGADARRGVSEGKADGRAASSDDNSRQASAAGNAAVSNYPGKVFAKLRRALRYPSEARGRRLNGTAQVQFVVSGSGSVGAVRLASSSGSPVLDQAAIATVHRAAPFPPIPEGAGRSSWTFTVPLAFVR